MAKLIPLSAAFALALGGCVETTSTTSVQVAVASSAPNSSAATWQMPWRLSPISPVSEAAGEQTTWAYVPLTGFVRGTPTTLAQIGQPLLGSIELNRTVGPCRDVVQSEAIKAGARDVEAVLAGAEQRDPKGRYFAPVKMRITYASLGGFPIYEVREATLTCIVDKQGKIVDAYD